MIRYFVPIVMFAACSAAFAQDDSIPDANALLQGVESSRLEIPASRLKMRQEFMSSNYTFNAAFDGARRRFWGTSSNSSRTRMILTGSTVTHFDGINSVTFHDVNRQNGSLFFDPRLLGISTTYGWNETLAKALPYRDGSNLRTIGSEKINGKLCWHVSVVDSYNQKRDLWIDDQNGFRVYRSDFSIPGLKRNSTISTYPEDSDHALPCLAVTNYYDANDIPKCKPLTISVLEAESGVQYPDNTWSYSSLDLPLGVPVTDLRSQRRIGYWDGSGLSLNPPMVANHREFSPD